MIPWTISEEKKIAASRSLKEKRYWQDKLSGSLELSRFPVDFEGPHGEAGGKGRVAIQLPPELLGPLQKLSNKSDNRLFMVLLASLATLMYKYTGRQDILVAAPVKRQEKAGRYVNTVLPLRSIFTARQTYKELLLASRTTFTEALEHQNYPLEVLVNDLGLDVGGQRPVLFDVALVLENIQEKAYLESLHFNMIFSFLEEEGGIKLEIEYSANLYREETIRRLAGHMGRVLSRVTADPGVCLGDIDLVSDEEKEMLMVDFNDTRADYPDEATVHRLFVERAQDAPDDIALVDPSAGNKITYGDLDERSSGLAAGLAARGVKRGDIVAVFMDRSIAMVTAMLAIMKTGAAYLPVDINYPAERIRYMLVDSGAPLLLTDKRESVDWDFVEAVDITDEALYLPDRAFTCEESKADDLLYVIYTSGATGRPKGVLIDHRGFVNMVYFHRSVFDEGPGINMSQVSGAGFDAMAFEIWPCLLAGGRLYFADDEVRMNPYKLREWLIANQIHISYQPTIMVEQLVNETWPREGVALRALRAAGDKLGPLPHAQYPFKVYNLYGPTEATVWSTWSPVTPGPDAGVPSIGKPVANCHVYILSGSLQLQPVGVWGELCIAGAGLARGYANRQDLTRGRFVANPLRETGQNCLSPIYRSGDLARWTTDGRIEFLGRIDNQVKIRGNRIELGEIENRLLGFKGIKNAAVVAQENDREEKVLYAYLVLSGSLEVAELKDYLAAALPSYMIPAYFIEMDELPLTPNGKVDSKRLASYQSDILVDSEFVAPRNELEGRLVEIWKSELHLEKLGVKDRFFHIGGDSINSIRLVNTINKELDINLEIVDLYQNETVETLAEWIESDEFSTATGKEGEVRDQLASLKDQYLDKI